MAGIWESLFGTMKSFFQIGGPSGPGLNNNAGVIEAKNAANTALTQMRAADPLGPTDVATREYVDKTSKPIPIALQFNGNNPLPSNSGTIQYYIVTTTGVTAPATIGQILYDNGTGTGTVQTIPAATGNEIVTEAAFTGGTISFAANQNYVWTGTQWLNISPNVSGAMFSIRFAIGTAATTSSVTSIPANAVVTRALVTVGTAYSAGATISIGQTGTVTLLQTTSDNAPQVAATYDALQDTPWGASALPVLVTIGGAPAAGAGDVFVQYSVPNA